VVKKFLKKEGQMIKTIEIHTGSSIEFLHMKNDVPGFKRCIVKGKKLEVDTGTRMVQDLVASLNRISKKSIKIALGFKV
jgi:hypothetical protein